MRVLGYYESLDPAGRTNLDRVLDYIRDEPLPDGIYIISVLLPPVVVYYYNDDTFHVSYGLSFLPKDGIFDIQILAIGPSS